LEFDQLAQKLSKISTVLNNYPIFRNLAAHISLLSTAISQISENDNELFKKINIFLESFTFVLNKWKKEIFDIGVQNPNMYDASLINDITMICDRVYGKDTVTF